MKRSFLLFALLTGFASADKYETANLKGTILCPPADTMVAFSPKAQALFGDISQAFSESLVRQLGFAGVMQTEETCRKSNLRKVYFSFDIDASGASAAPTRSYAVFAYVTDPKPTGYPGYVILWSRISVRETTSERKAAFDSMIAEVYGYIDELSLNFKTANP